MRRSAGRGAGGCGTGRLGRPAGWVLWFGVVTGCASGAHRPQSPDRDLADLALRRDDTIVTTSARTVDFNGQALVPRYVHVRKEKGQRDLVVHTVAARIVFGLTGATTVAATLPHVRKRLRRPDGAGGRETLRSEGMGDVPVVVKHRVFQETGAGETTEAAALFGLELPAGRTDVRDGGARLPAPLQPGSGSLDAIAGAAFTRVDGRWLLNADVIGKLNAGAEGYRFGNRYRFDVGGHFRLHPARYTSFDQTTVNLVLEANTVYAERDTQQGDAVLDSGGLQVFGTPGIQVIATDSLLFETAVQLPVLQDLHGKALEDELRVIAGLRFRF